MFFSIGILTRNRIYELRKLLQSIYFNEFAHNEFEILILDNASDNPLDKTQLNGIYSTNVEIIRLEKNIGLAAGRNLLAKKSKGEWLFFIDDDAFIPERQFFVTVKNYLEKNNNNRLAVLACNIIEYYKPWKNYYPFPKRIIKKLNFKKPIKCSYYLGGAHFIKRAVFAHLNGYDEALFFWGEELDFSYKAINRDFELFYHPDLLIIHKASIIKNLDKAKEHYYFLRNKIYINYKYLPWYIRGISNFIWLSFYFIRTRNIPIIFKAIVEARKLSKNTEREILSYDALKYLFTNYGRIFY
jgi:GT2 family glycosyltransferase